MAEIDTSAIMPGYDHIMFSTVIHNFKTIPFRLRKQHLQGFS